MDDSGASIMLAIGYGGIGFLLGAFIGDAILHLTGNDILYPALILGAFCAIFSKGILRLSLMLFA